MLTPCPYDPTMHQSGTVLSIDGDIVTMQPDHEDLTDPLDFPFSQLMKSFKSSDHVKVIEGRHSGQTGLVVKVEGENLTLVYATYTPLFLPAYPTFLRSMRGFKCVLTAIHLQ